MNIRRLFKKNSRRLPPLTKTERLRMRISLFEFIHENPVRVVGDLRHIEQKSSWSIITIYRYIKVMPIALLIAAVLSGGVSFAAAGSLPGDTLYPIKINVNEKVAGALALSTLSKAELETKLATRRLEEAEELAVDGRLKEEVRIELEQRFNAHADRVKARITAFEDKENFKNVADIESRFEGSLEAHEAILSRIALRLQSADANKLALTIRSKRDRDAGDDEMSLKAFANAAIDINAELSGQGSTTQGNSEVRYESASKATIIVAERLLTIATEYLSSHADDISADIKATVEAKITAGQTLVVSAKAQLEAKNFQAAFNSAKGAMRVATEAMVLMRTSQNIDAQVEIKIKQRDGRVETEIEIENDNASDRRGGSDDVDSSSDESGGKNNADDSSDDENEIEAETEIEVDNGGIKIETRGNLNL